jgi:hypothetical protein
MNTVNYSGVSLRKRLTRWQATILQRAGSRIVGLR